MVKIFNFENDPKEFSCNTYIIGKIGRDCLVIDPGSTSKVISEYIDAHHERCLGILLTHGHFDHIRGVTPLLKHFNYDIPVYISKEDAPLLTDTILNESKSHGAEVKISVAPVLVEDQEELLFNKEIKAKIIATPYHTKGSVCYLFEDDNAIFTGDSLFKLSIGRTDLKASDQSLFNSSMKKLTSLGETLVVYPGHGELTRLGVEKKTNPYLQQL